MEIPAKSNAYPLVIRALRMNIAIIIVGTTSYFAWPLLSLVAIEIGSDCSWGQFIRLVLNVHRADPAERIAKGSSTIRSDPAGLSLVQTPKGTYWVPKGTEKVLAIFLGQQEDKIYGTGLVGVHRGDIVLDCGANVGVYTREALDTGAASVVAIEPAPDNVESLRRNFAREIQQGRVIVYPKGVWNRDDYLTLYVYPHNSGADSFVGRGPAEYYEIKAPLTTIDKLVSELHLERVDFIKMDIKGAASQALTGASQTLSNFHPRLAISTEEPLDYPAKIQGSILAGWPGYRAQCGYCGLFQQKFVPLVMFYH